MHEYCVRLVNQKIHVDCGWMKEVEILTDSFQWRIRFCLIHFCHVLLPIFLYNWCEVVIRKFLWRKMRTRNLFWLFKPISERWTVWTYSRICEYSLQINTGWSRMDMQVAVTRSFICRFVACAADRYSFRCRRSWFRLLFRCSWWCWWFIFCFIFRFGFGACIRWCRIFHFIFRFF